MLILDAQFAPDVPQVVADVRPHAEGRAGINQALRHVVRHTVSDFMVTAEEEAQVRQHHAAQKQRRRPLRQVRTRAAVFT